MRSSHFGHVLQRRFLLVAQPESAHTANIKITADFTLKFMASLVILAKISVTI